MIFPERVTIAPTHLQLTLSGRVMIFVNLISMLIGFTLLFKNKTTLFNKISFAKYLTIVAGIYFVLETYNSIGLILKPVYKLDYWGSTFIKIKVLFSPFLFLLICLKSKNCILYKGDANSIDLEEFLLTPKEKEVLHLILKGLNNSEIESKLFISKSTLKTHINRLFSKVGVKTRIELIFKFIN